MDTKLFYDEENIKRVLNLDRIANVLITSWDLSRLWSPFV